MTNMKLKRLNLDDCTIGVMTFGKGFKAFTLELPWLSNQKQISCIPKGFYTCTKITSPSLGRCIEVSSVIGRTYIRIHKGNYTSQIQGCILVGDSIKDINGDFTPDVTNSSATFDKLMEITPCEFTLEID